MEQVVNYLKGKLRGLEAKLNEANQSNNEKDIEYYQDWIVKIEEMINIYHQ